MHRYPLIRLHPRLTIALVVGLIVATMAPHAWGAISRALVGWNCAIWSYLGLVAWLVKNSDNQRMHKLASQEDNNAVFVLVIMSLGAILSLAAIVFELSSIKNVSENVRFLHYGLTAATVLGSWLLVPIIYTFHYAHLFYRAVPDKKPLRFPDDLHNPGYWDFLYFAITIAVAAQTSDVCIMSTSVRKTVLAQSVLSFLFNAAIIGMTINIAAGLIGS